MEHVTSHRLGRRAARPDIGSRLVTVVLSLRRLASWLADRSSDPIGARLECQLDYDAQMLRRYDRRPTR